MNNFKEFINIKKNEIISEVSLIKSEKIRIYNSQQFLNKKSPLFIFGFSGSGKSTLGVEIASKFKCNFINEDYHFEKIDYTFISDEVMYEYILNIIKKQKTNYFIYDGVHILKGICENPKIQKEIIKLNPAVLFTGTSLLKSAFLSYHRSKDIHDTIKDRLFGLNYDFIKIIKCAEKFIFDNISNNVDYLDRVEL